MAQKVTAIVKLQIPAGKATPAPPVGSALGPHGINIMGFTKEFNERTKNDIGLIIPVVITVYADRSFSFITKTPPAAVLIKKECGIDKASGVPNKQKVAKISKESVRKIAEIKMPDLNAASIESAMSMVAGTARSMGIFICRARRRIGFIVGWISLAAGLSSYITVVLTLSPSSSSRSSCSSSFFMAFILGRMSSNTVVCFLSSTK